MHTLLAVALEAAREATEIILAAADQPHKVDHKGRTNLVTETDRRAEERIITVIRDHFPQHTILAEESGKSTTSSDFTWIVDPLDGTTNFVHGYPSYAVSIGVWAQNRPQVSVVVELPFNHVYAAVRGSGATCNDQPIHVSPMNDLSQALLVTGFGYEHNRLWHTNMELFKQLTDITQGVRRLGSAAVDLCHVASGKVDAFWELDLHPWDTAGGVLLVQEAGGLVTTMRGDPYSIFHKQILASNGALHDALLSITRPKIDTLIKEKVLSNAS
ncbi:MAG: inositol monophosphatase family protein [Fidelibacterota bacterium]